MRNTVFIFVGIILLGVSALVYYVLGQGNASIVINGVHDHSAETRMIVQYSVGGFLAILGLFFLIVGLRGRSGNLKQQKQITHIIQTGISASGTVTFVDRNYSVLINKKPIYSIVEYTYQDKNGKSYSRRVETIPSDYVIRNKVEVGCSVSIKYASDDYSQSTILLI